MGASPLYRSALLIDSGQITCTYVNVVYPSIPASPEYLELGLPGDIKLVRVPSNGRALDELVINYNAGPIIPTASLSPARGSVNLCDTEIGNPTLWFI